MNIVQLTPGAGGMYCGNCFRDNALVAALRRQGHATLLMPLYLPLRLDETDQSAGTPVFFSGVNVYLEQKAAWFRRAPGWLHALLARPALLRWTAGFAAKTRPDQVGDLLLSMLRGEEGNQARELVELIAWLRTQPKVEAICLSNALLVGMARQLRRDLDAAVVCMLQGEDSFLDALPVAHREAAWRILAERVRDADLLVSPSQYFAARMEARLGLPASTVRIVPNGLNLEGYDAPPPVAADSPSPAASWPPTGPVLGYFARMCPEKGLDTLVEAFILLRRDQRVPGLKLRVGGGCGPLDQPFVDSLRQRLQAHGLLGDAEFLPNLDRAAKLAFLRSLTVFSVPAQYGEAFGLYVLEALAAGVPVVQPRHAAFPELLAATGGGVLCEPGSPAALAEAIESLLRDPVRWESLRSAGRRAVAQDFSVERMADNMLAAFRTALARRRSSPANHG